MDFLMRNLQLPDRFQNRENSGDTDAFRAPNGERLLQRLSRLNVLIGPNNCGKSRLHRELFRHSQTAFTPPVDSIIQLDNECDHWEAAVSAIRAEEFSDHAHRQRFERLVHAFRNTNPPLVDSNRKVTRKPNPFQVQQLLQPDEAEVVRSRIAEHDPSRDIAALKRLNNLWHRAETDCQNVELQTPHFVFIPATRGLRNFGDRATIPARIAKDHFDGLKLGRAGIGTFDLSRSNILCGSEFYDGIRDFLLGNREQREAIRAFEDYLASKFFNDDAVTIVPRHDADVLYIKIGTEVERPIYDLGDGLSHLIILTLPLFIHRKTPLLLFIEEPENYLHPGFQRAFIDAVLDTSDGACRQVFVTTHSHQFLDITIDQDLCTIYRIKKHLHGKNDQQAYHEITVASSDNRPLLRELGVRNSSLLLSNCTIWVEGVIDRLYFRHYLDVYQRSLDGDHEQFLEDVHFSFVEYSGNNITHWSFLDAEAGINVDRLCSRLMLIADRDEEGRKDDRHEKLEASLRDRFLRLECREVENLLTPETLKAVIKEYEGNDVELQNFSQDDYQGESLGEFIETHVLAGKTKSRRKSESGRPYSDKSGTIKDKDAFCRKALSHIESTDDVSPEAFSICQRIYDFITENNK